MKDLLKKPGVRYLIVGGGVYVFELAVILIAQALGAGSVTAVGIGFILGTTLSFFMQKLLAFQDKRMHHKVLLPQLIASTLLVVFNFGFTLVVTAFLTPTVPATIARTFALGCTVIWNFYLYKTHIFKGAEAPIE